MGEACARPAWERRGWGGLSPDSEEQDGSQALQLALFILIMKARHPLAIWTRYSLSGPPDLVSALLSALEGGFLQAVTFTWLPMPSGLQ